MNRSVSLAKILGVKVVISPKLRKPNGEIEIVQKGDFEDHVKDKFPEHSDLLMPFNNGNLKGKLVAIREDELSTGGTANKTGKNLKKMGVDQLFFCGTHPVCAPGWKRQLLDDNPFDRIYLGDTIPRSYQNRTGGIVTTVSMASVIAGDLFQQLSNGHF